MNAQITYTNEGNPQRGRLQSYHSSFSVGGFRKMNKTAFQYDLTHMPSRDSQQNIFVTQDGELQSKFSIGFEVEKNSFHRGAMQEYPLFSHFESDRSCGVEAVTNILPLIGKGVWRNKVLNMMTQAKKIIDDNYSPSNRTCGGHITLSCNGLGGHDLAERMRPFSGIIYALYRFRLRNKYCSYNIFMDTDSCDWEGINTIYNSKYQVCKIGTERIEFRLPSRFTSVADMNHRYRLMYEVMDFAVNNPNGKHSSLLRKLKPILMMMYNNDEQKVAEILALAKSFRKMLMTRKINHDVQPFVDREQKLKHLYTRSLRRDIENS